MSNPNQDILFSDQGPLKKRDLTNILIQSGITAGDIVMVHSRLFTMGRFNTFLSNDEISDAFIDILREMVGQTGSLIFPTFTLSVCKKGYFNVKETRSETGSLSERARLRPESLRTCHPFYSVAIMGPAKDLLVQASLETCFGSGSLFDVLHLMNQYGSAQGEVKFLTIGVPVPPEVTTYIHYIEEKLKVPYRYYKEFQGNLSYEETTKPYNVRFYVRDLFTAVILDVNAIWAILKEQKGVNVLPMGNSIICSLPEKSFYNAIAWAIEKKADFLCQGGYHPVKM